MATESRAVNTRFSSGRAFDRRELRTLSFILPNEVRRFSLTDREEEEEHVSSQGDMQGDFYGRLRDKLLGKAIRAPVVKLGFGRLGPHSPVTVFHHLPKCGGTSLLQVLRSWFVVVNDYRSGWTARYPSRVDLGRLSARYCLAGHFELPGYHLHQRYPEVVGSPRYRLITFLRDPLEVKLSLYRFELEQGVVSDVSIEEHLLGRPNYLASVLPASDDDYREVLDRYSFIGILEDGQASLNLLAHLLGKPRRKLPAVNRSSGAAASIPEQLVRQFREASELDYAIYDYGVSRYRTMVFRSNRMESREGASTT